MLSCVCLWFICSERLLNHLASNLLTLSVPGEGYSINAPCTLNKISTNYCTFKIIKRCHILLWFEIARSGQQFVQYMYFNLLIICAMRFALAHQLKDCVSFILFVEVVSKEFPLIVLDKSKSFTANNNESGSLSFFPKHYLIREFQEAYKFIYSVRIFDEMVYNFQPFVY